MIAAFSKWKAIREKSAKPAATSAAPTRYIQKICGNPPACTSGTPDAFKILRLRVQQPGGENQNDGKDCGHEQRRECHTIVTVVPRDQDSNNYRPQQSAELLERFVKSKAETQADLLRRLREHAVARRIASGIAE